MIQGFNIGQMFHFSHMELKQDGFIPVDIVNRWKSMVPPSMQDTCRMSGTMSNLWALDITGYNYDQHNIQLSKNKINKPSKSYGYAFVDFYKNWGFKNLVWTLNTHKAFIAKENGDTVQEKIWEKRMWDFLDFIISNDINISHICLDNEWWMDYRVCGISAGSPNAGDKIRMAGTLGLIKTNSYFEPIVKDKMNRFMIYLKDITEKIRQKLPNALVLCTVDNPSLHLRGRWMFDVVKSFSFYDGVTCHIYPKTKNTTETNSVVDQYLNPIKNAKLTQNVTEWNFHYDSGSPYDTFHKDMISRMKFHGVRIAMRHSLWAGNNNPFTYGWIKI